MQGTAKTNSVQLQIKRGQPSWRNLLSRYKVAPDMLEASHPVDAAMLQGVPAPAAEAPKRRRRSLVTGNAQARVPKRTGQILPVLVNTKQKTISQGISDHGNTTAEGSHPSQGSTPFMQGKPLFCSLSPEDQRNPEATAPNSSLGGAGVAVCGGNDGTQDDHRRPAAAVPNPSSDGFQGAVCGGGATVQQRRHPPVSLRPW